MNSERGFTLIEVLAALLIGSIVFYGAYALLYQTISIREKFDKETVAARAGKAVLGVIEQDLDNVYINRAATENTFYMEPGGASDNRSDALFFLAIAGNSNIYETGRKTELRFIGYKLLPRRDGSGLNRLVRYSAPYNPSLRIPSEVESNPIVLSDKVKSFKVTCRKNVESDEEWDDRWQSQAISKAESNADTGANITRAGTRTDSEAETDAHILPYAVKVEITFDLTPDDAGDIPDDERIVRTNTAIIGIPDFYTAKDSVIWGFGAVAESTEQANLTTREPAKANDTDKTDEAEK